MTNKKASSKGKGKRKPVVMTQRRDMIILPNSLTEVAEESNIRRRHAKRLIGKYYTEKLIQSLHDSRRPKKPIDDLRRNLLSRLAA